MRYFKGCVPYEGECIVCYFMWDLAIKSSSLLKMISSYYKTLLSNRVGSICSYVPPFVLVTQRQMREMGEGNRFFWPTFIFLLSICWKTICPWEFLRNWTFVIIIRTKKPHPCHRRIYVTWKFEKQSLRSVSCTGNCVYKPLAKKLPFMESDFSNMAGTIVPFSIFLHSGHYS